MTVEAIITGFGKMPHVKAGAHLGLMDTAVYAVQNTGLYKVQQVHEHGITTYYRYTLAQLSTGMTFDVIIHCDYPLFTGITRDSGWIRLDFIDLPASVIDELSQYFTYLPPEMLNRRIQPEDLAGLEKREAGEIRRWRVNTFGEVIFNGWD